MRACAAPADHAIIEGKKNTIPEMSALVIIFNSFPDPSFGTHTTTRVIAAKVADIEVIGHRFRH